MSGVFRVQKCCALLHFLGWYLCRSAVHYCTFWGGIYAGVLCTLALFGGCNLTLKLEYRVKGVWKTGILNAGMQRTLAIRGFWSAGMQSTIAIIFPYSLMWPYKVIFPCCPFRSKYGLYSVSGSGIVCCHVVAWTSAVLDHNGRLRDHLPLRPWISWL